MQEEDGRKGPQQPLEEGLRGSFLCTTGGALDTNVKVSEEALLVAAFLGYSCGCCLAPGREAGVGCSQTSICSTSLPSFSYRDLG